MVEMVGKSGNGWKITEKKKHLEKMGGRKTRCIWIAMIF